MEGNGRKEQVLTEDESERRTHVFVTVTNEFPTTDQYLVTMVLEDCNWNKDIAMNTFFTIEAIAAAEAVDGVLSPSAKNTTEDQQIHSDIPEEASFSHVEASKKDATVLDVNTLNVHILPPSSRVSSKNSEDPKLLMLCDMFPQVKTEDIKKLYLRNSKNVEVIAQKILSRLHTTADKKSSTTCLENNKSMTMNAASMSNEDLENDWPLLNRSSQHFKNRPHPSFSSPSSIHSSEAIDDAHKVMTSKVTMDKNTSVCSEFTTDKKLNGLISMFPNVNADVIASVYYHNSKNIQITAQKILSKSDPPLAQPKSVTYSNMAAALTPSQLAKTGGIVPVISSRGDFPTLLQSSSFRQTKRLTRGTDSSLHTAAIRGDVGPCAEPKHEQLLSDVAKFNRLREEFSKHGLGDDELEDMLVRCGRNIQKTRFRLVSSYTDRLPTSVVDNYYHASCTAKQTLEYKPSTMTINTPLDTCISSNSVTLDGMSAAEHRAIAQTESRAMQNILTKKLKRRGKQTEVSRISQTKRGRLARRRGGGRTGGRALTARLSASAQIAFMDEHRQRMRKHNAAAAQLIFCENNGGSIEELLLGRTKPRRHAGGLAFDLHGLHVQEAISIVSTGIKIAKRHKIASLTFITGVGQHSDRSRGPRLLPHVKAFVGRCGRNVKLGNNKRPGEIVVKITK